MAPELDVWADVLHSGTADAPPVTMMQAIGHTFRKPSAGDSSQGLLTAAATDGALADGWQRLYFELYRGALRLAARPNERHRGSEDRSRGVLPLVGQVSRGVG